jgi:hypothetical protein
MSAKCHFRDEMHRSKKAAYSITLSAMGAAAAFTDVDPTARPSAAYLLCHGKRPELRGKAFHEVLVGEDHDQTNKVRVMSAQARRSMPSPLYGRR